MDTPNAEAFRFWDRSIDYATLSRSSNGLAHALIDCGVHRGDRVGILLGKCLEAPTAVFGTMKAGAAYVPLDPTAPAERLASVMEDCGIRVLITHDPRREALDELLRACPLQTVIGLDPGHGLPARAVSWDEVLDGASDDPPQVGVIEQDMAYIIYTSGSTGTPKGIVHTHYSGLSFAQWIAEDYGIGPGDRLTNHAPLHFDMSTLEYFVSPVAGSTTVIVPEEITKLPASYSQLLQDERITVFYVVPYVLVQLLLRGALDRRDVSALRWIIYGGESSPTKYIRGLMEMLPHVRFSHMYGPTETNGCTRYNLPGLPEIEGESVPIGPAFSNMEVRVVDEADQSVGVGETGELWVRGPTLMQGYWGRPDLNERVFVRRAPAPGIEQIFYRTGDHVELLHEGNLRFIGRVDRQIKVRGFRVELDEIESALMTHHAVEECAVYALPDGEGSNVINAAVLLKAGGAATGKELKARAGNQVPWYAVPSVLRIVQSLPRTSTGKIDRRALIESARGGSA